MSIGQGTACIAERRFKPCEIFRLIMATQSLLSHRYHKSIYVELCNKWYSISFLSSPYLLKLTEQSIYETMSIFHAFSTSHPLEFCITIGYTEDWSTAELHYLMQMDTLKQKKEIKVINGLDHQSRFSLLPIAARRA